MRLLRWWGTGWPSTTAWSPDGNLLAVGSPLGVYLYNPQTLEQVKFILTDEYIDSLAFSPDGKTLATGSKRVRLWEVSTGKNLGTLPGSIDGYIATLAYSAGGIWLAAGGPNGGGGDPPYRLLVWQVDNGQLLYAENPSGCGWGTTFAFSPDGRTIAIELCDNLGLYRASTGEWLDFSAPVEFQTDNIVFSTDGKAILGGDGNKNIQWVDIQTGEVTRTLQTNGTGGDELYISPDGKKLAVLGTWDEARGIGGTEIIDLESGATLFTLANTGARGGSSFSPDSRRLASIGDAGLEIWSLETGQMISAIPPAGEATSVSFGPLTQGNESTTILAVANTIGQVFVVEPDAPRILNNLQVSEYSISHIALHPNGLWFAVSGTDGEKVIVSVRTWETNQVIREIEIPIKPDYPKKIYGLAFSLDGEAIAAKTSPFSYVQAWKIQTGEQIDQPEEKTWVNAEEIGADHVGHLISFKYRETEINNLEFRDKNTGLVLATTTLEPNAWLCQEFEKFAVSSDGRYFALGCDMPDIPVWDLKAQQIVYHLVGHEPGGGDGWFVNITDITFSPFGYLLASSGVDDTIRFWNANTGELLLTLKAHACSVSDIAFSPDGRYLASAGCDGAFRLWGIPEP